MQRAKPNVPLGTFGIYEGILSTFLNVKLLLFVCLYIKYFFMLRKLPKLQSRSLRKRRFYSTCHFGGFLAKLHCRCEPPKLINIASGNPSPFRMTRSRGVRGTSNCNIQRTAKSQFVAGARSAPLQRLYYFFVA